jgi:hypothetical protein
MVEQDFKAKFKQWFDAVSGHDIQEYQDLDWDWEQEIGIFLETPTDKLDALIADAEEAFGYVVDDDHN